MVALMLFSNRFLCFEKELLASRPPITNKVNFLQDSTDLSVWSTIVSEKAARYTLFIISSLYFQFDGVTFDRQRYDFALFHSIPLFYDVNMSGYARFVEFIYTKPTASIAAVDHASLQGRSESRGEAPQSY